MSKCPICSKGSLVVSGSHEFCDACTFTRFIVTPDYIESSKVLVATLLSNTSYPNEDTLIESVGLLIEMHLPMLYSYMRSMVNGQEAFLIKFTREVDSHCINLQVGPKKHNEQELPRDLVCSCGSTNFYRQDKITSLKCRGCSAGFEYNKYTHRYEPIFSCTFCGWNKPEIIDEVFSQCGNCKNAHYTETGAPL